MPTHSHMHVHVCAYVSYVAMCVYMGECKHAHGDICGFTHAYAGVCEEVRLCVYLYMFLCVCVLECVRACMCDSVRTRAWDCATG